MAKRYLSRFIYISALLFLAISSSIAQQENLNDLKPGQLKKFGKNAAKMGDIYTAINYYEKYIELKKDDYKTMFKLADLYRKARDYKKAMPLYEKVNKEAGVDHPTALFYLALMQKMNGDYVKSKENFVKYKKEKSDDEEEKILKKLATIEIAGCDLAKDLRAKPLKINITHLDTSINKAHVEFAPFPVNDSTLLYSSLKEEALNYYVSTKDSADKKPVRQMYIAKKGKGGWKSDAKMPGPFNLPDVQTGNGAYSADGKRFYFTRCIQNWQGKMICSIYVSRFDKGEWKTPEMLSDGTINSKKFTSTQPTVGTESKLNNEVVYFISDRPGGKGGTDIWFTVYDAKKKTYKPAQNVGGKLNTIGDEFTPFYDGETKTLYFSSTGWPGLGGFDVFKSVGELKNWAAPVNVGYPINSSTDDIYGVINKNHEGGFFVSNREGGISLKSATCCDDIYDYNYIKYIHLAASGTVFESTDTVATRLIENSKEQKTIFAGDSLNKNHDSVLTGKITPKPKTIVSLYLVDADNKEIFIKNDTTDQKGHYNMRLEQGNNYRLVVNSPGYLNKKINISTKESTVSDTINSNIGMNKIPKTPMIVRNIYYPFDKATLNDESKANIDSSIYVLLRDNPQIIIEISSHTDSKGADDYNMKLSQKRAESVVDYLINIKGVDKKRLVAKGYGKTKPIAANTNPDGTDNPDGRQMNRRTELRVVGVLDKTSEVIYED